MAHGGLGSALGNGLSNGLLSGHSPSKDEVGASLSKNGDFIYIKHEVNTTPYILVKYVLLVFCFCPQHGRLIVPVLCFFVTIFL